MESESLPEIRAVAQVHPGIPRPEATSKQQRLKCWPLPSSRGWAELSPLIRSRVFVFWRTSAPSCHDSPLTVAFQDDHLRTAGLESDRLGDTMRFFWFSDNQGHFLVCDCYYGGGAMDATQVARGLRSVALTENGTKKAIAVWGLWVICALPVAALIFSVH